MAVDRSDSCTDRLHYRLSSNEEKSKKEIIGCRSEFKGVKQKQKLLLCTLKLNE